MSNLPINLRGHHLSTINAFTDLENFRKLMVQKGYSNTKGNFISEVYTFLKNLRENPNQKIRVIAGEPDFICERCPQEKRERCLSYNQKANPLYGSAFWDSKIDIGSGDRNSITKANLEIGKIYPVNKIIQSTIRETKELKKLLKDN